jgi:AraC family transcriptional regulator
MTQRSDRGSAQEPGSGRERNAFRAMSRLLSSPPPIVPGLLPCGTQLTRRWKRDGFNGYAPAMAGHLIATYYGDPQACTWTLGGRRYAEQLRPGTVTITPEGHDGQWTLKGPVAVSHVYLTHERVMNSAGLLSDGGRIDLMNRLGFEDPVSARILEVLSDADVLTDPGARLLVDGAVDLLCLQLLRRHNRAAALPIVPGARGGLAAWQVRRVTDYMLQHLDQPIGLEDLAAQARLSRYHFCTAFRITTGRTPHAWLTEQRMARARSLLSDPDLTVSQVALAVGYATQSAFAASFRKVVGLTPTQFRRGL